MAKHRGGHGRNKEFCKRYKADNRREKNKAIKLHRTIKRQPTNKLAIQALAKLPGHEAEAELYMEERAEILKERENDSVAEAG